MFKAWFEKYRPRSIDDVIFPNENIEKVIRTFYDNEFINGNILSYGAAGLGKTTINEVLINRIVKNRADIFILDRKIDSVDELTRWLQQRAASSKQKIVKIEEIDRLSSQAQVVLKDGLLEKYQTTTSFLATTNNPEKMDSALLTRFNTKIHFTDLDENKILERAKFILDSEKIKYNLDDLKNFVNSFKTKGLRDIINNLELASISGTFDPSVIRSFIGVSDTEDTIIKYAEYLIKYFESLDSGIEKNIIKDAKNDTHFFTYYEYILKVFKSDLHLNFDYIFMKLLDSDLNMIHKKTIQEFYQDLDLKRFKTLHFLTMFAQILENIYDAKGGKFFE